MSKQSVHSDRRARSASRICVVHVPSWRAVTWTCVLWSMLGTPTQAQTLQQPVLLAPVSPVYPPEAPADAATRTVRLQLTLDARGHVSDALVIDPLGDVIDTAAREAALLARFQPALRDGAPIGARIQLAVVMQRPGPPAPTHTSNATIDRPQPTEVRVQGARRVEEQMRRSAEAVTVIEADRAHQQSGDMGDLIGRAPGVIVRRDGGLGSDANICLNGLCKEQLRYFWDSIPFEMVGLNIASLPVSFVQRLELYRGVVPMRFAADALGGAVNFASAQHETQDTHGTLSYQVSPFGTRRFTLEGKVRDEHTGWILGAAASLDVARNDYDVNVTIPDERGRPHPATVRRFHDGYYAYSASLQTGVVDRPWAKRLLLRVFSSDYDKELQHNVTMTVPYGEVTYGETIYGSTLHYEVAASDDVALVFSGAYAHRSIDYSDQSQWVYDWNGRRVRKRPIASEVETKPTDQTVWQDSGYGRALLRWRMTPQDYLRVVTSAQYVTRQGEDHLRRDTNVRDPLTALSDLTKLTSGVEYERALWRQRLSTIGFLKHYYYSAQSEEPLTAGAFKHRDATHQRLGVGVSSRLHVTPWLYVKASYEYTTRMPRPDEVFGDAVLVHANLELAPETSHNANLGPRLTLEDTPLGSLSYEMSVFLRDSKNLIVLLGNDRHYTYQNVYGARSVGIESIAHWIPQRWLEVDGALTWQEVRNTSDAGTFADFDGDRIPNRPYLFGNWGTRCTIPIGGGRPAGHAGRDTLEPFYSGRYTHAFYRSWESIGLRAFKQMVGTQVSHTLGVSWVMRRRHLRFTATAELENLAGAVLQDNFGVQLAGRAFNLKLTGELH